MAIAKNPPSTAAFANRLITRLVIQHAPPTLPSSSSRFTLSSRPSAFRDATSADPLLLAFHPTANLPLAVIQRSVFRDEGSLFDSHFLPGRKPRVSHPPFFIFRSPPKSPPTAQSTHQSSPSSTPQYPTPKSAPPTDTPRHSQTAPPSSPP